MKLGEKMIKNLFKPKLKKWIVLLRNYEGIWTEIKTIRMKSETQKMLKLGDQSYKIEQKYPNWKSRKGNTFWFFDIDEGTQLTYNEIKNLDPRTLDKFVGNKFIQDISTGLNPDAFSLQMKNIFIGVAIGAGIMGTVLMILNNIGVI